MLTEPIATVVLIIPGGQRPRHKMTVPGSIVAADPGQRFSVIPRLE
jgi:hypothetical protein